MKSPSTSGLAVASLVCGIVGFCVCPLSLLAIIFGHIAHSQIGRSEGAMGGSGLAIAGFSTGYVGILLGFLMGFLVLPALIIPAVTAGREKANQMQCQAQLRIISTHYGLYYVENERAPTRDELMEYMRKDGLADDVWHCPSSGALEESYELFKVSVKDFRRSTPTVVLLRDAGHPHGHHDGCNVCYLDGKVEFIEDR